MGSTSRPCHRVGEVVSVTSIHSFLDQHRSSLVTEAVNVIHPPRHDDAVEVKLIGIRYGCVRRDGGAALSYIAFDDDVNIPILKN
jgi:hypothetical protein